MATILASRSASKAAFGGRVNKGVRVSKVSRVSLVCRAEKKEETAITKVERIEADPFFYHFGAGKASLTYLNGTLPGDYGFDPLGLMDPVNSGGFITPEWLAYSEVYHGRWAMLGVAGMIGPEILGSWGAIPEATRIPWFATGVMPFAGTYDDYWTDPYSLFYIEAIAMNFAELKRYQDFRYPGSQGKQYFIGLEYALKGSGNPAYPGGPWFNLFNLGGKSEAEMFKLKRQEIENGRLAMISVFGFGAQAITTHVGPYQNLLDHLADPTHNNIATNFGKVFAGAL